MTLPGTLLLLLSLAAQAQDTATATGRIAAFEEYDRTYRRLVLIDVATEERETLLDEVLYSFDSFDDQHLVASPDGQWIAVNARTGRRTHPNTVLHLHLLRLSPREHRVPFERAGVHSMAFSPEGTQLAFEAGDEIWIYDLEEDTTRMVAGEPENGGSWARGLTWDSEGPWLFATLRDRLGRRAEHVRLPLSGEGRVTLARGTRERVVAALPRRHSLLIQKQLDRDFYAPRGLIVLDLRSNESREIARDGARHLGIAVSKDDSRVAYQIRQSRTLRVVTLDDGEAIELGTGAWPSFSPDGRWLAYQSGGKIHAHRLRGEGSLELGPGIRPVWVR